MAARRLPPLGVALACAAHFLVGADGLAVAIALPTLQDDLGAAPIDAQWVLTAYGLAFGGALLLAGRLGDSYGRRRMLVYGMALFAAGSLLAGLAPTLGVLVGARALQGLGSAASVPAALALIGSLVPPGPERTRALSLLAAMASVGIVSGLLVGGILTDVLGWRWVFLLMAPVAMAVALGAPLAMPEVAADAPARRPDVIGAVLVTTAMVAGLFGLTRVEHSGPFSAAAAAPVVAGAMLLAAFVVRQHRTAVPLVRLAILRGRSLRTATLGGAVNAIAFTAIVYAGTQYMQTELRYSPSAAGVALLPLDVVAGLVPVVASGLIARHSPRLLLALSFAVTGLALLWLARAPGNASYAADLLGPLLALGVSLPVAFVVLTQQAIAEVEPDEKGVASGIFETANHLVGGAVGVAIYATLIAATGGFGAAFGAAAAFAALGVAAALQAPRRVESASP